MSTQAKWCLSVMLALMTGLYTGLIHPRQVQQAAPAFAAYEEDDVNLFVQPSPTAAFSIEVVAVGKQQRPRVLIYHTHTYEAFEQVQANPYRETEKWRTSDNAHNMVRVGEELAALLTALGVDVTHDTTAFEPPVLSTAYSRSLEMLEKRKKNGETYDLYIDLHRDAYSASYGGGNTVSAGGTPTAKLMLLIGKGEGAVGQGYDDKPDWQANFAIAQAITQSLNTQVDGLCRDVCVKSGRYNQHVAPACILVEAGNNRNTLSEVLAAMPYLADAIAQMLQNE